MVADNDVTVGFNLARDDPDDVAALDHAPVVVHDQPDFPTALITIQITILLFLS